jgi:hypothetical protein
LQIFESIGYDKGKPAIENHDRQTYTERVFQHDGLPRLGVAGKIKSLGYPNVAHHLVAAIGLGRHQP